jgi:hypothetical protein
MVVWCGEDRVHDAALDQRIRRLSGHQEVGQGGEDGGILGVDVWHRYPPPFGSVLAPSRTALVFSESISDGSIREGKMRSKSARVMKLTDRSAFRANSSNRVNCQSSNTNVWLPIGGRFSQPANVLPTKPCSFPFYQLSLYQISGLVNDFQ